MIVEALQDKNVEIKGEAETQKKLFGAISQQPTANVASASNIEMEGRLRDIQRQLDRALEENNELKLFQKGQSVGATNVPSSVKEAVEQRDKLEEELTVYKNQDRVIREKCT